MGWALAGIAGVWIGIVAACALAMAAELTQ